jgi:AcrR family transcriptional regulator
VPRLRDDTRRSTHKRIESVALDLFLRHGYAGTTVEDIANASGVSVRTLYRYFPSKDALLFEGFQPALEQISDALRHRDRSLPPLQSLQEALAGAADVMESVSEVLKHIWQLAAEEPSLEGLSLKEIQRWRTAFATELAEQAGRPVHDRGVQLLAIALHGVITAGVAQWRAEGANGPLADEIRLAAVAFVDLAGTADATLGR